MPMDIKICGLKTEEALAAALAGGASHVGFIFFPKSPRNIEPEEAGRLRQAVRGKALAVAVTVDADDELLDRIVAAMAPDMLQLHGHESPARVAEVKARYGLPVIKAFSIATAADLGRPKPMSASPTASCSMPSRRRGPSFRAATGSPSTGRCSTAMSGDYLLSGGLNAGNVGEAIRRADPPGLDISSGVETAPGIKDPGADRGVLPRGTRRKCRKRA